MADPNDAVEFLRLAVDADSNMRAEFFGAPAVPLRQPVAFALEPGIGVALLNGKLGRGAAGFLSQSAL